MERVIMAMQHLSTHLPQGAHAYHFIWASISLCMQVCTHI